MNCVGHRQAGCHLDKRDDEGIFVIQHCRAGIDGTF
jgi:hypothetical protein